VVISVLAWVFPERTAYREPLLPPKHYIFNHNPKTGGNSLLAVCRDNLEPAEISPHLNECDWEYRTRASEALFSRLMTLAYRKPKLGEPRRLEGFSGRNRLIYSQFRSLNNKV
jgi:hypothetical protein